MNIVAGFGPFGTLSENPSSDLARQVAERVSAHFLELPTSYDRSRQMLHDLVDRESPRLLLMFGYAARVDGLRVETVGRNVAQSKTPDIDGVVMAGHAQEIGGPATRSVSFDVDDLVHAVEQPGCRIAVSTDAGGYVCNWTLYGALGLDVPHVSFAHVGATVTAETVNTACAVYRYLDS